MKKLAVILMLIGCLVQSSLWALQVTPPYQVIELKPGEAGLGECEVTNNEEKDLNIKIYPKDWFVLPENKANNITATDWLAVDTPEFILKPGESRKVEVMIKAPEKAVGELVGMISVEFFGEVKTMVNQMVSVAVYATVLGTEKMKTELEAISIMPSSHTLQIGVQVKNTGNMHVRPAGTVRIFDLKKKLLRDVAIQQARPVYPGRTHSYYGQIYGDALKPGKYMAHILLRDVDRNVGIVDKQQKILITKDNKVELVK